MKLFILGNGFDIAHQLDSKYSDFKRFLERYNPEILESDMPNPVISLKEGKLYCDSKNAANIIWHLINNAEQHLLNDIYNENIEWQHIEESMGKLDYSECFDSYFGSWNYEDDCPECEWKYSLENQYRSLQIAAAVLQIQDFFRAWVNQVDISKANAKKDFKKLISKEDFFINFNYTHVLESVYQYENIWHIHGQKDSKKIIFGHGNIDFDYEDYENILYGSAAVLKNIHNALFKDVFSIITENSSFWKTLKDVSSIYTYGFSYSYVDLPYIAKIIESCPKCKEWYIEEYPGEEEIKKYIKFIKDLGFKGSIKKFKIEK